MEGGADEPMVDEVDDVDDVIVVGTVIIHHC